MITRRGSDREGTENPPSTAVPLHPAADPAPSIVSALPTEPHFFIADPTKYYDREALTEFIHGLY